MDKQKANENNQKTMEGLTSITKMNMEALKDLLAAVHTDASLRGKKVKPEVFAAVITAIYSKGYIIAKRNSSEDLFDSFKSPRLSSNDIEEEFHFVISRTNSTVKKKPKIEKGHSSDFEVDIEKEQKVVYDTLLIEKIEKAKKLPDDTILQKEIAQASKKNRRLSYEEFVSEGGSFDHLMVKETGSFYRQIFVKNGVFPETEELGEVFTCKAGPSSLIFLDGSSGFNKKKGLLSLKKPIMVTVLSTECFKSRSLRCQ